MSIIQPTSLSSRTAGHIRSLGPYSNTYRASAPMWTHKEIADRKKLGQNYWPLNFVHDGLVSYFNANDPECLLAASDSNWTDQWGYNQPGLDNLADGKRRNVTSYSLQDFQSLHPGTTHATRTYRLYAFGEGNNNAAISVNTDTGANNGKSLYVNGNGNYVSILDPTYHDSVFFPTDADKVKNITLQAFVKAYLNDGGAYFKIGWKGWEGHPTRPDDLPDGIAIGIGSGDNTTNVFGTNGNKLVARYCGVSGANFNTSTDLSSGWQMITLTLNSSSTAKLYKNTTLAGTFSSYTPVAASYWGYFGRNAGDGEHVAQMNIGIGLIYNKELSSSEISQNYNIFKGYYGLS